MRQDRWETPALGPGLGVVGWTPVGWDCSESGPWGDSGGVTERLQLHHNLVMTGLKPNAHWARGPAMQRQRGRVLEGSAGPPKEHDLWETGQEGAFFSYDNKCYEVKEETQQENAPPLPPTQVQGLQAPGVTGTACCDPMCRVAQEGGARRHFRTESAEVSPLGPRAQEGAKATGLARPCPAPPGR